MAAEAALAEDAPAKLNLYLHVTGKRPDGYHLLDSLVVFAGAGDRVFVDAATGLSLAYTGPFQASLPPADDNLVMKAAQKLKDAFGIAVGARLILEKNLPPASGIGGGSADAAATLRVLCRLWGIDPAAPALAEIALSLGADVPVCLAGRPAFMQGIGETLLPCPALPPVHAVLVNPGMPVPTPAVFKARTGGFSPAATFLNAPADAAALAALLAERRNDLEVPAKEIAPAVADALKALSGMKGALIARMSGSGATCFALFASAGAAGDAARALRSARPDWWVSAAPILG